MAGQGRGGRGMAGQGMAGQRRAGQDRMREPQDAPCSWGAFIFQEDREPQDAPCSWGAFIFQEDDGGGLSKVCWGERLCGASPGGGQGRSQGTDTRFGMFECCASLRFPLRLFSVSQGMAEVQTHSSMFVTSLCRMLRWPLKGQAAFSVFAFLHQGGVSLQPCLHRHWHSLPRMLG